MGGRGAYWRGGAYFKFWPIGGALIRRGRLFEGGAYSKIYSITMQSCSMYMFIARVEKFMLFSSSNLW